MPVNPNPTQGTCRSNFAETNSVLLLCVPEHSGADVANVGPPRLCAFRALHFVPCLCFQPSWIIRKWCNTCLHGARTIHVQGDITLPCSRAAWHPKGGGGGLHPHTEVREAKRDQKPSFGTTMGSYEPSLGWGWGGFLLCDVSRAPPSRAGSRDCSELKYGLQPKWDWTTSNRSKDRRSTPSFIQTFQDADFCLR